MNLDEMLSEETAISLRMAPISSPPADLPVHWAEALSKTNPLGILLGRIWAPVAHRFPRTLTALGRSLQGVGLLSTDRIPSSLIYCFRQSSNLFFWRGFPPAPILRSEASLLPRPFLDFYEVHDGWTDLFGFMGPMRSGDWYSGSDSRILIVAESGGEDSLGYDLSKSPPAAFVCSNGRPATKVSDVFGQLDPWIGRDLQEFDARR